LLHGVGLHGFIKPRHGITQLMTSLNRIVAAMRRWLLHLRGRSLYKTLSLCVVVLIAVFGNCRDRKSDNMQQSDCAPVIARHPSSLTVLPHQTADLHVEANGEGPFTYEWYEARPQASLKLPGKLSTITVNPDRTTQYFVWVYNKCGGRVSNLTTVTVK